MANEYNTNKGSKLSALKLLAQRTDARLDKLEGETLVGVKVNGVAVTIADRIVDILIATGTENGTLSVAGVDVAVKGLAALAYKANISKDDLADTLKAEIEAKAKQADIDTLTGTGEGSIAKMIDDAFDDFASKVSDDGVVNSFKELVDWVAAHGSEAAELAEGISTNAAAIESLKALVGELPEGATATTVVGYIAEAIAALSIDDYAKAADLTAAVARIATLEAKKVAETDLDDELKGKINAASAANHSHDNKTALDGITEEDVEKLHGIEFASDEEVNAMLDEVYGPVDVDA